MANRYTTIKVSFFNKFFPPFQIPIPNLLHVASVVKLGKTLKGVVLTYFKRISTLSISEYGSIELVLTLFVDLFKQINVL